MYVVPESDRIWLLTVQRRLHERSRENPTYVFQKLWGLVTDPRNLRIAFHRVASNRGRRTAGVDGITVGLVLARGVDTFIEQLRTELRGGAYRPVAVRRVLIPKGRRPGEFRPLGIPTVRDRVTQAAVKNILEPIFEADFYPTSHGFRPGKSVHGALEELRKLLRPRESKSNPGRKLPYQWAIEGDIKGCFDNISHHGLMDRIRRRIADAKVNRLVLAFLKAGVFVDEQFTRAQSGTPQGGILSPLLANIALSAIDERYERHVWPRRKPTPLTDQGKIIERANYARRYDRRTKLVFFPIRYADDFIILVSAPPGPDQYERAREAATSEKAAIGTFLKEQLNLELSEAKTLVTSVMQPMRFLGHHVRVRAHPTNGKLVSTAVIPKDRSQRLRDAIKVRFKKTTDQSLQAVLTSLNPLLRGWSYFYRHAWGAKHVFSALDNYVWWTIYRWLRKKHRRVSIARLRARYGWSLPGRRGLRWRDGDQKPFEMAHVRVGRFRTGWLITLDFASTPRRARCRPKDARRVRKGAPGNRPSAKLGTAPGAYLTRRHLARHVRRGVAKDHREPLPRPNPANRVWEERHPRIA